MFTDTSSLAAFLVTEYARKGLTLSLAESCTGGALSMFLTDVSGVSRVFKGSAVVYSNSSKIKLLGVSSVSLETFGAVSEAVAQEMALGARQAFGSDVGLSITGIAGPGGGTEEKPVGTVWMGLSTLHSCVAQKFFFEGSREIVRKKAVTKALNWLIEAIIPQKT